MTYKTIDKQNGASLISSLMFLIIISLVGLATANSSVLSALITHNAALNIAVKNDLKNTLIYAVKKIKNEQLKNGSYLDKTKQPTPPFIPHKGINQRSEFVIEYLGCFTKNDDTSKPCGEDESNPTHIYHVTAKVKSQQGDIQHAHQLVKLKYAPNQKRIKEEKK